MNSGRIFRPRHSRAPYRSIQTARPPFRRRCKRRRHEARLGASLNWADLGIRTLSALVLIPLVLLAEWAGGIWFELLVVALGCAVAWEWTQHCLQSRSPSSSACILSQHSRLSCSILVCSSRSPDLLAVLLLQAVSLLLAPKPLSIWKLDWRSLHGPARALRLLVLRNDPGARLVAVIWCFAIVWAADILAYFAGPADWRPKARPLHLAQENLGRPGRRCGRSGAGLACRYSALQGLPARLPLALLAAGCLQSSSRRATCLNPHSSAPIGVKDFRQADSRATAVCSTASTGSSPLSSWPSSSASCGRARCGRERFDALVGRGVAVTIFRRIVDAKPCFCG